MKKTDSENATPTEGRTKPMLTLRRESVRQLSLSDLGLAVAGAPRGGQGTDFTQKTGETTDDPVAC